LVRFGFQGSSVEGFEFLADVASKIVRLGHAVIIAEIWTLELLRCERCEDFEVHRRFFDVCGVCGYAEWPCYNFYSTGSIRQLLGNVAPSIDHRCSKA
jgi:hypothetical protein